MNKIPLVVAAAFALTGAALIAMAGEVAPPGDTVGKQSPTFGGPPIPLHYFESSSSPSASSIDVPVRFTCVPGEAITMLSGRPMCVRRDQLREPERGPN
jgi:hypothetical protein